MTRTVKIPSHNNIERETAENHRHRVAAERRGRMRARLLRSALGIAAAKGPSMMSIDDVIQAAKVSRGTFYKYFPSPDALIHELATEIASEVIHAIQPLVRTCRDPADRVARGIRLISRVASRQRPVAEFLVRLGWPDESGPNVLAFVRDDIEEGFRLERFSVMPMAMALNIVAGAVLGAMRRSLEPDCPEDIAEQAAAVALRALGVKPAAAERMSRLPLEADVLQFTGAAAGPLAGKARANDDAI